MLNTTGIQYKVKKNVKDSTQGKWQETNRKESELTTILLICLIPTVVHAIAVK